MKNTDLRIGNYVKDDFGRIGYIVSLSKTKATVKLEFSSLVISYHELEPILLTGEWLLKLGLVQSMGLNNFWTPEKELNILFTNNNYWFATHIHDGFYEEHYKIYTVHQLQNIVHALSGEELVLNESRK